MATIILPCVIGINLAYDILSRRKYEKKKFLSKELQFAHFWKIKNFRNFFDKSLTNDNNKRSTQSPQFICSINFSQNYLLQTCLELCVNEKVPNSESNASIYLNIKSNFASNVEICYKVTILNSQKATILAKNGRTTVDKARRCGWENFIAFSDLLDSMQNDPHLIINCEIEVVSGFFENILSRSFQYRNVSNSESNFDAAREIATVTHRWTIENFQDLFSKLNNCELTSVVSQGFSFFDVLDDNCDDNLPNFYLKINLDYSKSYVQLRLGYTESTKPEFAVHFRISFVDANNVKHFTMGCFTNLIRDKCFGWSISKKELLNKIGDLLIDHNLNIECEIIYWESRESCGWYLPILHSPFANCGQYDKFTCWHKFAYRWTIDNFDHLLKGYPYSYFESSIFSTARFYHFENIKFQLLFYPKKFAQNQKDSIVLTVKKDRNGFINDCYRLFHYNILIYDINGKLYDLIKISSAYYHETMLYAEQFEQMEYAEQTFSQMSQNWTKLPENKLVIFCEIKVIESDRPNPYNILYSNYFENCFAHLSQFELRPNYISRSTCDATRAASQFIYIWPVEHFTNATACTEQYDESARFVLKNVENVEFYLRIYKYAENMSLYLYLEEHEENSNIEILNFVCRASIMDFTDTECRNSAKEFNFKRDKKLKYNFIYSDSKCQGLDDFFSREYVLNQAGEYLTNDTLKIKFEIKALNDDEKTQSISPIDVDELAILLTQLRPFTFSNSKSKIYKNTHNWTLENFPVCYETSPDLYPWVESIKLPVHSPIGENFKIYFKIYPKGHDDSCKDYVSLFVHFDRNSLTDDQNVKIKIKISILGILSSEGYFRETKWQPLKSKKSVVFRHYILQENLNSLKRNESISFLFEVWFQNLDSNSVATTVPTNVQYVTSNLRFPWRCRKAVDVPLNSESCNTFRIKTLFSKLLKIDNFKTTQSNDETEYLLPDQFIQSSKNEQIVLLFRVKHRKKMLTVTCSIDSIVEFEFNAIFSMTILNQHKVKCSNRKENKINLISENSIIFEFPNFEFLSSLEHHESIFIKFEVQTLENRETIQFDWDHQPINPNYYEHISDRMQSDFVINFDLQNKKCLLHVHKVILLNSQSPVLRAMLQNPMRENIENKIKISDIAVDVFEQMIKFIYTGKFKPFDDYTKYIDLFIAADQYQIEDLKLYCEQQLCRKITLESVYILLIHAERHNASDLREKSFIFLENNLFDIIQTESFQSLKRENIELLIRDYPRLNRIFDTRIPSDVTFEINGTKIHAHKTLLASESTVFKQIFQQQPIVHVNLSKNAEYRNLNVEAFKEMLNYIYSLHGVQESKLAKFAEELLVISEKFKVECLKNDCEIWLCQNRFSLTSISDLLVLAVKTNSEILWINALDYFHRNSEEIVKTREFKKFHIENKDIFVKVYLDSVKRGGYFNENDISVL